MHGMAPDSCMPCHHPHLHTDSSFCFQRVWQWSGAWLRWILFRAYNPISYIQPPPSSFTFFALLLVSTTPTHVDVPLRFYKDTHTHTGFFDDVHVYDMIFTCAHAGMHTYIGVLMCASDIMLQQGLLRRKMKVEQRCK